MLNHPAILQQDSLINIFGEPKMPSLLIWLADRVGSTNAAIGTEVARLKETEGGPILIQGSATLGNAPADAGLVDRDDL